LYESDVGELAGVVAPALRALHDADVAARTLRVTRTDGREELLRHLVVVDAGVHEAAVRDAVGLGAGDELLHERTELLGLGLSGRDALVYDERTRERAQQSSPLVLGASERPSFVM